MAGTSPRRIRLLQDEIVSKRPALPETPVNLSGLTSHRGEKEVRRDGDCIVVFPQSAYRKVVEHLSHDVTREHGGFLLGYETWSEEAHAPVVVVEHAIPASHTSGTPVRLTFTKESWRELDANTEKLSQNGHTATRVGWYHSHPNISIFLSHWDLDVCKEFDRRQNPIALVVDPVNRRGGFFVRGKSGYQPHDVQGFLEQHDLQETSIVDWTNLTQDGSKTIPISGLKQDSAPADPGRLQRQLDEISALLRQTASRSRNLAVLAMLLAVSLSGALWYALTSTANRSNADAEQAIANLRIEVGELGKAVADLEGKIESEGSSGASGASSASSAESVSGNSNTDSKAVPAKPLNGKKTASGHPANKNGNQKGQSGGAAGAPHQDSKGDKPAATGDQNSSASSSAGSAQQSGATASGTKTAPSGSASQPVTGDTKASDSSKSGDDAKSASEPNTGDIQAKPPDSDPKKDKTTSSQESPPNR